MKNGREIFKPITERSNRNRIITFDKHLKTTLKVPDAQLPPLFPPLFSESWGFGSQKQLQLFDFFTKFLTPNTLTK